MVVKNLLSETARRFANELVSLQEQNVSIGMEQADYRSLPWWWRGMEAE